MSYVLQDELDSQVTLAIDPTVNNWWQNPLTLSLQREDGSYIGADMAGNLFAIGTDGSVLWQHNLGGGALTPLYATADGGAIVTSTAPCQQISTWAPFGRAPCPLNSQSQSRLGTLYTVDQNGNTTSQTPDTGATMSWTGQFLRCGKVLRPSA